MADTIRDYLVSLGFDIDSSGQAKFEATLKGVAANVVKLGAVVESSALAIVGFTTSIANGLDKLYWASQRTGATVNGIKALGYAASQTGTSAEAAQNSLESLARFMRSNPGAEGFLNRLGVQTRDASGQMRDMSAIFTGVGQRLSSMPYYRANQYAQMLGIDENTLMSMRRGLSGFSAEYQSMMQKTGFNADKAAVQSNKFMTSMRGFVTLLGIMRDKVGSNLADGLSGTLNNLSKRMLENWPKIEEVVTKVVKGVLWAADAIGRVAWRITQAVESVIAWFKKLSPATQQLIGLLAVMISGWRLLNTEFLQSPIGIILALGAAIFALWDDYETWKEGGKSLIDWEAWEPDIRAAIKGIDELWGSVKKVGEEIANLLNIDLKNWTLKGDIENLTRQFGEFGKMMSMIGDLLNAIKDGNWKQAYAIGKQLWSQGQDQPTAIPEVVNSANNTAEWIKDKTGFDPRSIGRWLRGETEPEQHAQSARRSRGEMPLPQGAGTIAELVNNYARKAGQENNQALIASLSRATGIGVDSKLLSSDLRDLLKVLREIAQNINQPGSIGAAEIINSPQVLATEQSVKRPQASAQGRALLEWMQPMFNQLESLYRLPEGLLKSVAITESGGNQFAMSGAGAKGLFQFMDGTARDMGLRGNDVFDPMKSAQAAAKYLSQLLQANGGDLSKTLASYNWGIGNVQRYGMDLMPKETRNYIPKVMSNMPGGGAQISQETNINIYGALDPASTGREVADRQSGVNSRLTQQLQPRIY